MKKNYLWITLIGLMVMMTAGFVSCSKDGDKAGDSDDLLGTWARTEKNCDGDIKKYTEPEKGERITCKKDGTYISMEGDKFEGTGKWEYKDGKLFLKGDDGYDLIIVFKSRTSSAFVFADKGGCDTTYTKI